MAALDDLNELVRQWLAFYAHAYTHLSHARVCCACVQTDRLMQQLWNHSFFFTLFLWFCSYFVTVLEMAPYTPMRVLLCMYPYNLQSYLFIILKKKRRNNYQTIGRMSRKQVKKSKNSNNYEYGRTNENKIKWTNVHICNTSNKTDFGFSHSSTIPHSLQTPQQRHTPFGFRPFPNTFFSRSFLSLFISLSLNSDVFIVYL